MMIFGALSVLAFIANNWSDKILGEVPVLRLCANNESYCVGALTVHRMFFGLSLFHGLMAILLLCVRSSRDPRASLQDSWWSIKLLIIAALVVVAFFIPNEFFIYYGYVALGGAFVFILIQLVLLVECAYLWNAHWLGNYEEDGHKVWIWLFSICTIVIYILSLALMILLFVFFYKSDECWMNIVFPIVNICCMILYSFLSISPRIQSAHPAGPGLLQSAVVGLYSSYLVFSAAISEPNEGTFQCNPIDNTSGTFSTLLLGASFTIVAVSFSTVRTATKGDDLLASIAPSKTEEEQDDEEHKLGLLKDTDIPVADTTDDDKFNVRPIDQFDDEDKKRVKVANLDDEENEVKYNYTFFHITFCVASMFVMMLITNWQEISKDSDHSFKVNHGFAAVWVKLASSWVVALLYIWTLVAPALFPDRDFGVSSSH